MASENTYDFIIAGGGTAGVVLATRLSQSGFTVCLLEAGHDLKPARNDVSMVVMATAVLAKPDDIVWPYKTSPQSHLNGREVDLPAGRVLGGSSNINYAIWTRGNATDFQLISKIADDPSWTFPEILPYFKKVETFHYPKGSHSIRPELHGDSGPVHIVPFSATDRQYKWRSPSSGSYEAAGFAYNTDINDGNTLGYGDLTSSSRFESGGRQSARTYLADQPTSLTILGGKTVEKVLFEGKHAVSVRTVEGEVFKARKEVLVCAGSLRSPAILQLSGIGPKDLLKQLNIPIVVDSPGVGENFWDHPILHLRWRVKEGAQGDTVDELRVPQRIKEEMAIYASNGTGLLGGSPFEFTAWKNLSHVCSGVIENDIALSENYRNYLAAETTAHSQYLIAYGFANGRNIQGPDAHISMSPMLVTPTARGFIRITSADPTILPTFNPNWLGNSTDRELMKAAVKAGAEIMEAPVWKQFLENEVSVQEGSAGFSDEAIERRLNESVVTTWHYGGTCAMGAPGNKEVIPVVDSQCRVYGVAGLRVVDMSVYPVPISANTQAATYALAEKIADVMLAQHCS